MENIEPIDRGKQTHKIIKSSLKNILNNYEDFIPIIENTILRTNKIITYVNFAFLDHINCKIYLYNIFFKSHFSINVFSFS